MTTDVTQQPALEAELAALKLAYAQLEAKSAQLEAENAQLKDALARSEKDDKPQLDSLTDEPDLTPASHLSTALGRLKTAVASKAPTAFRRYESPVEGAPTETTSARRSDPGSTDTTPRTSLLGYAVASIKGRIGRPGAARSGSVDAADASSDDPTLPKGWEAKVSRSNDKTYYINRSLKITQWEHPSTMVVMPATGTKSTDETNLDYKSCDSPAETEPADEWPPLAPGWLVKVSRSGGRTYYVNPELKLTTWERPTASAS
ncbi:hypothetical protein SPRG_02524 [Saprolegnia parasitica CBS 223.65]|uniref:WW domain-containing protein n=1 Tax=Saprolegnia parasitica (strain CBS 223.65) TaxID=695850 RepID=A0A067D261_SAPPC|nr:hypothetical protein SPRG_02524 [Saprolegnia parasitica CBS 223.65]KDO32831.1 hypothetical protein SPRG_02524 [Saprolegnia parasitica CBS 223.65]|eukprot:XP_012196486.1 hypothetical protein SPRG_02524 [Saprolegnia parasitica CBS 223.65]